MAKKDKGSDRERAIRQIKALLETAGRTEAEIEACAAKVQELLIKYHLSMSDVKDGEDPAVIRDTDFLSDEAEWIKSLLNAVAKLYFCGYYTEVFPGDWIRQHGLNTDSFRLTAGDHKRAYLRHNFIGKQVDVVVAKAMGQYLAHAMQDLCRAEEVNWPRSERPAFRVSFMNACTARLRYRLNQKRLGAQANGIKGANLPAVRSLYEQAQDAARDFLKQQGIIPDPTRTSLANIEHQGGAVGGWTAGGTIGLDDQITDAATTKTRHLKGGDSSGRRP